MKRSKRGRAKEPGSRTKPLGRDDFAIPMLLVAILSQSGLALGYFWDDFYFLTGALADPLAYVKPTVGATFFRPIPQGIYFLLLSRLGSWGALTGHLINAVALAISALLLGRLATRLSGRKAGLFAAIAFATMGAVPTLVAWTSCSQDLFAITFFLGALTLRDRGRSVASAVLALAALLSKETAVALLPVLVLWDWIVGRKPARLLANALLYGVPVLLWAAIHPGLRALAAFGFRSGITGYVGLEHPERWGDYAAGYAFTLLNLPRTGLSTSWPTDHTVAFLAAFALLLAWLYARRGALAADDPPADRASLRRVALVCALLAIPPILMASIMVRRWNPYFACIPALGTSLLFGALAARLPARQAAAGLAAFLLLGVWSRGMADPGPNVFTERDCRDASRAARTVKARFALLAPSFAPGSNVLVSVGYSGKLGMMGTLHDNQALQIWYHDPTLTTLRPERRRDVTQPEYLFRVTSDLEVVEIDPERGAYRTNGGPLNEFDLVGRTIRSFARGLGSSGDGDRAVRILDMLGKLDGEPHADYDRRLAAMIRYSQGRRSEAESLKARTQGYDRDLSIAMIAKLLGEPTRNAGFDSMVFQAFDVSGADTAAVRHLLRTLHASGVGDQAFLCAERMLRLAPGDAEAAAILREESRRREAVRVSGPNALWAR